MKRCKNTALPVAKVGSWRAAASQPYWPTNAAYTLWSMLAHTSPMSDGNIRSNLHKILRVILTVYLVERSDRRVAQRVDRRIGRVRVVPNTFRVHVLAHDEVVDVSGGLLEPVGHSIGPPLTHAACLSCLEAAACTTTGHAVGDLRRH